MEKAITGHLTPIMRYCLKKANTAEEGEGRLRECWHLHILIPMCHTSRHLTTELLLTLEWDMVREQIMDSRDNQAVEETGWTVWCPCHRIYLLLVIVTITTHYKDAEQQD